MTKNHEDERRYDDNHPRRCLHARDSEHVRQRNNVVRRIITPGAGNDILHGFRCVGRSENHPDNDSFAHDVGENVETYRQFDRDTGRRRGGDRGGDADHAEDFARVRVDDEGREERIRHRHEKDTRRPRGARHVLDRLYLLHATMLQLHDTLRSPGMST